jgi:Family of unknown function (DUF6585)
MSEENKPSQHPEWQDPYLETAYSLPYVDTQSQPSHGSPPSQPASQPAQQPAARTEIDQLVALHRLGKVKREYKNEVSNTLAAGLGSCMLGVLCSLPIILDLITHAGYFPGMRWTIIIGIGFLGYGINRITVAINNFVTNMHYQNPRSYFCSYGVMSIKGKQVQAIRWDQIRTVQKIFLTDTSSIPQQYILYPPGDEEPVVLDRLFIGFKLLGEHIEREVSQRLLPETIAAYKAGQTLNFGALNVMPQGLSLEEARKDLPWANLGGIYEARGYLVIQKKGTLTVWRNVEVSTMLNLCVLLPLIRQIKIDNRIRGDEQRSLSYQPPANDLLQPSEWQEYE